MVAPQYQSWLSQSRHAPIEEVIAEEATKTLEAVNSLLPPDAREPAVVEERHSTHKRKREEASKEPHGHVAMPGAVSGLLSAARGDMTAGADSPAPGTNSSPEALSAPPTGRTVTISGPVRDLQEESPPQTAAAEPTDDNGSDDSPLELPTHVKNVATNDPGLAQVGDSAEDIPWFVLRDPKFVSCSVMLARNKINVN